MGGAALLLAAACARAPAPAPVPAPAPRPPAAGPPPPCQHIVSIEIDKHERELLARCQRGARVLFPVALGRDPVGTKRSGGDWRTPEGLYHIVSDTPSRFHRFLLLDYPSLGDAQDAYLAGRIGGRDYRRIARAHREGKLPPQDTPLGGGIGLHGEGPDWHGFSTILDWTYGCIAMSDRDIDFIAKRVEPGTPVRIRAHGWEDQGGAGTPGGDAAPSAGETAAGASGSRPRAGDPP